MSVAQTAAVGNGQTNPSPSDPPRNAAEGAAPMHPMGGSHLTHEAAEKEGME